VYWMWTDTQSAVAAPDRSRQGAVVTFSTLIINSCIISFSLMGPGCSSVNPQLMIIIGVCVGVCERESESVCLCISVLIAVWFECVFACFCVWQSVWVCPCERVLCGEVCVCGGLGVPCLHEGDSLWWRLINELQCRMASGAYQPITTVLLSHHDSHVWVSERYFLLVWGAT
jgi:hypothetical protein